MHHFICEDFLLKTIIFSILIFLVIVIFRSKQNILFENCAFWPKFAIFDLTNTVIIVIKIRSDLPPSNIYFIRPLFNYLVHYHISNQIQTPLTGPLICVKMQYASPDFYNKRLYM